MPPSAPSSRLFRAIASAEVARVNLVVAVLIWLMIIPMLLKIDFAALGRPMFFFAYDLEHYRDDLRGFYLDYDRVSSGDTLRDLSRAVSQLPVDGACTDRPAATD